MNNIPYKLWPQQFEGTMGFPFYDSSSKEDFGDPIDFDNKEFKSRLKELRNALEKMIKEFRKLEDNIPAYEQQFSIYFGDVTDTLRNIKKRTISDLEKMGFNIICDIPPPFEFREHQEEVRQKLKTINLSVHLLDQYPGREIITESGICYPQTQVELALESGKPQLIWLPEETDFDAIENESYKIFINDLEQGRRSNKAIKYIRGLKSTLTNDITDVIDRLKFQAKLAPENNKLSVLLDAHEIDAAYAWELGLNLAKNHIRPLLVDTNEENPLTNINMLSDRISQANKLVFFYGQVDWKWVRARVNASMKFILNNQCAADEFFIFMVPPRKQCEDIAFDYRFIKVNLIDSSDPSQSGNEGFEKLFKIIKPGS